MIDVTPTGRKDGLAFHFKTIVNGEEKYLEMIKEEVANCKLSLVCSNSWNANEEIKCKSRWSLPIIGLDTEERRTKGGKRKFDLKGELSEQLKLSNYGTLFHVHTKKCTYEKGNIKSFVSSLLILC